MIGSSQLTQQDMAHLQIDQRLAALGQFLVILAQAAVVVQPAEGSLDKPTSRQHRLPIDRLVPLYNLPYPAELLFNPVHKPLATITTIGLQQSQSRQGQLLMQFLNGYLPPGLSWTSAVVTRTSSNKPRASTTIWRFRLLTFSQHHSLVSF